MVVCIRTPCLYSFDFRHNHFMWCFILPYAKIVPTFKFITTSDKLFCHYQNRAIIIRRCQKMHFAITRNIINIDQNKRACWLI